MVKDTKPHRAGLVILHKFFVLIMRLLSDFPQNGRVEALKGEGC